MMINVDDAVYISAKDACLTSAKTMIVGSIRTSGDLTINSDGAIHMRDSASSIYCNSLDANAYGYAGTDEMPLKVYARSKSSANSYLYGECLLVIPIVDETNGNEQVPVVRLSGGIAPGAVVTVNTKPAHANCDICEYLLMHALQDVLTYVNIQVDGEITGQVQVEIKAENLEEGQEVVVLVCYDGIVYAIRGIVRNGFVTFLTEKLGAFLVLRDLSQLDITPDGNYIRIGDTADVISFGGWL
jgi:hypothetical protein